MEPSVNPAAEKSESVYAAPIRRVEHAEGSMTRLIEQQTARVPSDFFLFVSLCAMTASFVLEVTGRRRASRFIGMWPGPLLTMGVYNKVVKLMGQR